MTPTLTIDRPQVEGSEAQQEEQPRCRHHWIIEAAKGPTSSGVCKHCGAQRQFVNYLGDLAWEHDGVPWAESFIGRWNAPKTSVDTFE